MRQRSQGWRTVCSLSNKVGTSNRGATNKWCGALFSLKKFRNKLFQMWESYRFVKQEMKSLASSMSARSDRSGATAENVFQMLTCRDDIQRVLQISSAGRYPLLPRGMVLLSIACRE